MAQYNCDEGVEYINSNFLFFLFEKMTPRHYITKVLH